MAKKDFNSGIAALMQTDTRKAEAKTTATAGPAEEKKKGNYKTVCYSIPPDIAEAIKEIAVLDRRTVGSVVTEAFLDYLKKWQQRPDPAISSNLKSLTK